MTTAEATAQLIYQLPEDKLLDAQKYIKKLLSNKKRGSATQAKKEIKLKNYTKEEFLALADQSVEDTKAGRIYTLKQVKEMTKEKYGI